MKKSSNRIREEIARLQEVLKAAETREAERIGRIALKAGLGEIALEDTVLQDAFEEIARRFRTNTHRGPSAHDSRERQATNGKINQVTIGETESKSPEA